MKIERYFKLIVKKWWIIVLLEIVALSLTYYFAAAQPKTYTSTTTVILNPNSTNSIIPYTNPDSTTADTLAVNYNLVLKSENFVTKVIAQLDFPITADQLKQSFTSNLTPNTLAYNISATSSTPERAYKITTAVLTVFLENQTNQSNTNDPNSTTAALQTQLTSLNSEIDQLNKDITALNAQPDSADKQTSLSTKKDELSGKQNIKAQTVLAISDLEGKTTTNNKNYATVLNTPKLPTQPDASNLVRNLIFAFALALALGVGVIFLLYYIDTSIRSSDDLVELTGKLPVAYIPEIIINQPLPSQPPRGNGKDATEDKIAARIQDLTIRRNNNRISELLVTSEATYSPAAEAYRALRTSMLFSGHLPNLEKTVSPIARTFLVTSSLPGEGRSITAANLAIAFAQTGKKVILIDSDLRHPIQHELFNIKNEIGFSDLAISGITKLTKAAHSTVIPNLVLVPSGNSLGTPSELLTSTKAANVIKFFKNIADIVIFDSPPVNVVTDAAILASMVDQIMLVVEDRVTQRSMVATTIEELGKVGAHLDGIILNRVKDNRSQKFKSYFNTNGNENGYHRPGATTQDEVEAETENETNNGTENETANGARAGAGDENITVNGSGSGTRATSENTSGNANGNTNGRTRGNPRGNNNGKSNGRSNGTTSEATDGRSNGTASRSANSIANGKNNNSLNGNENDDKPGEGLDKTPDRTPFSQPNVS